MTSTSSTTRPLMTPSTTSTPITDRGKPRRDIFGDPHPPVRSLGRVKSTAAGVLGVPNSSAPPRMGGGGVWGRDVDLDLDLDRDRVGVDGKGVVNRHGLDTPVTGQRPTKARLAPSSSTSSSIPRARSNHNGDDPTPSFSHLPNTSSSKGISRRFALVDTPTNRGGMAKGSPAEMGLLRGRGVEIGSGVPRRLLGSQFDGRERDGRLAIGPSSSFLPSPSSKNDPIAAGSRDRNPASTPGQLTFAEPISPPDSSPSRARARVPGRERSRSRRARQLAQGSGRGPRDDEDGGGGDELMQGEDAFEGSGREGSHMTYGSFRAIQTPRVAGRDGPKVYGKRARPRSHAVTLTGESDEEAEDAAEEDGSSGLEQPAGSHTRSSPVTRSSSLTPLTGEEHNDGEQEESSSDASDENESHEGRRPYPSSELSAAQDEDDRAPANDVTLFGRIEPRGHAYELQCEESFRPAGWGRAGSAVPEKMMRSVRKQGSVVHTRSGSRSVARPDEREHDASVRAGSGPDVRAQVPSASMPRRTEAHTGDKGPETQRRPRQAKVTNYFDRASDPSPGDDHRFERNASAGGVPVRAASTRNAVAGSSGDKSDQPKRELSNYVKMQPDDEMVDMSEDSQHPVVRPRSGLVPRPSPRRSPRQCPNVAPGPSRLRDGLNVSEEDLETLPIPLNDDWVVPDSQPEESEVDESLALQSMPHYEEIVGVDRHNQGNLDEQKVREPSRIPSSQMDEQGPGWLGSVAASGNQGGSIAALKLVDRPRYQDHPEAIRTRLKASGSHKRKLAILSDEEGPDARVADQPSIHDNVAKRQKLLATFGDLATVTSPRRTFGSVSPNARSTIATTQQSRLPGKENTQVPSIPTLEKLQDKSQAARSQPSAARFAAPPEAAAAFARPPSKLVHRQSDGSVPASFHHESLVRDEDSESRPTLPWLRWPARLESAPPPTFENETIDRAPKGRRRGRLPLIRPLAHDIEMEDPVSPATHVALEMDVDLDDDRGRVLAPETLMPERTAGSELEAERECDHDVLVPLAPAPLDRRGTDLAQPDENDVIERTNEDSFSVGRTPSSPRSEAYEQTFVPPHIRLAHQNLQPGLVFNSTLYIRRRAELLPWEPVNPSDQQTPPRQPGPKYLVTPDEVTEEDGEIGDMIETHFDPVQSVSPVLDSGGNLGGPPAPALVSSSSPAAPRDGALPPPSLHSWKIPSRTMVTPVKNRLKDESETLMQWSPARDSPQHAVTGGPVNNAWIGTETEEQEGLEEVQSPTPSHQSVAAAGAARRQHATPVEAAGLSSERQAEVPHFSRNLNLQRAWLGKVNDDDPAVLESDAQSAPPRMQRSSALQGSLAQYGFFRKERDTKRVEFREEFQAEADVSEADDDPTVSDTNLSALEAKQRSAVDLGMIPLPPPDPRLRPAGLRELRRQEGDGTVMEMPMEDIEMGMTTAQDAAAAGSTRQIEKRTFASSHDQDISQADPQGDAASDDDELCVPSSQAGEGDSFCSDFAPHESDAGLDDEQLQDLSIYGWLRSGG